MNDPLIISSSAPILSRLNFKPFRSKVERRVVPYLPGRDEPMPVPAAAVTSTFLPLSSPWAGGYAGGGVIVLLGVGRAHARRHGVC